MKNNPAFPDLLIQRPPEKVYALTLGDSRTYQNHSIQASALYRMMQGWFNHLNCRMKQRFTWEFAQNTAVNGATTTSVAATRLTTVKDWCDANPGTRRVGFLYVGVNDILAGVATATMMTQNSLTIEYCLQELNFEKLFVIGEGPLPYAYLGTQTPAQFVTRTAQIKDYNAQMQAYCDKRPNTIYIPIYNEFTNYFDNGIDSSWTGSEDIHPSANGAMKLSAIIEPYVRQFYGDGGIDKALPNVFTNPYMDGNSGSNGAGTVLTGDNDGIPDGYYLSTGSTGLGFSRHDDGSCIISFPPGGEKTLSMYHSAGVDGFAIGKKIVSYLDYEILEGADRLSSLNCYAACTNNTVLSTPTLQQTSGFDYSQQGIFIKKGILASEPLPILATDDIIKQNFVFTLEAGNNGIKIKVNFAGNKIIN